MAQQQNGGGAKIFIHLSTFLNIALAAQLGAVPTYCTSQISQKIKYSAFCYCTTQHLYGVKFMHQERRL